MFRGVLDECLVILLHSCLYNGIKPTTVMQISEFSVGPGYLFFMLLLKFNLFNHETTLVQTRNPSSPVITSSVLK